MTEFSNFIIEVMLSHCRSPGTGDKHDIQVLWECFGYGMKKVFSWRKLEVVCCCCCNSTYLRVYASTLCPWSAVCFVILKAPIGSSFAPHLSIRKQTPLPRRCGHLSGCLSVSSLQCSLSKQVSSVDTSSGAPPPFQPNVLHPNNADTSIPKQEACSAAPNTPYPRCPCGSLQIFWLVLTSFWLKLSSFQLIPSVGGKWRVSWR